MDINEAAAVLEISGKTLRKLIRKGEVHAKFVNGRRGRQYEVDEASLERYKTKKLAGVATPILEEKKAGKVRKMTMEVSKHGGRAFLTSAGPRIGNPSQYLEFLPDILTVEQVADYLHMGPEKVREFLRSGKLRGLKIGSWKISKTSLEIFKKDLLG